MSNMVLALLTGFVAATAYEDYERNNPLLAAFGCALAVLGIVTVCGSLLQ